MSTPITPSEYRPRVADTELDARLKALGAVLIEGPKACGKTATARRLAASEVLLDVDPAARRAVAVDPQLVLEGETPRLIDEWQLEPELWNYVRRAVDDRGLPGQFILAGSAVPPDDATRHSGAGRITRLRMRPMSLFESGGSSGEISLEDLLAGNRAAGAADTAATIPRLADDIVRGGWPGLQHLAPAQAQLALTGYLDEIRRVDVGRVDAVRRDPERVGRLMQSLARNVSTYAAATTLAADTGGAEGPLKDDTVREYLAALERLMVVEDQPAWAPHLRSRYVLRSAARRHFVDPSLAAAALRASPERLLADLNLFGFLFESLVIRDLRVYAQPLDARVLQYRDSDGLEVDAIVEAADGRWCAFEIKLGHGQVEEGAATLAKFAARVDQKRTGPPAVLGVIVGMGYAYVRDDGINVIPIGLLGP